MSPFTVAVGVPSKKQMMLPVNEYRAMFCGVVCAALQCVPQNTIHPGPVSLIRTYNTRVWTSGGTSTGCSLIEWSIFGEFRTEVDITDSGGSSMAGHRKVWRRV